MKKYCHYLTNRVELAEIWFYGQEWDEFAAKAAPLLHYWFRERLKPPLTINERFCSGIFRYKRSNSVLSINKIRKGLKLTGRLEVSLRLGPDWHDIGYFYFQDSEAVSSRNDGIMTCQTDGDPRFDALVVALYALASVVTKHRLYFSSDGGKAFLQEGLSVLRKITGIEFDPDCQDYTAYLTDQTAFNRAMVKAMEEAKPSEILKLYADLGGEPLALTLKEEEAAEEAKKRIYLDFRLKRLRQVKAAQEFCAACVNREHVDGMEEFLKHLRNKDYDGVW